MDVYECIYTRNSHMSELQTLKPIVCFVFNFDIGFARLDALPTAPSKRRTFGREPLLNKIS